jgi:hypothetical protein
MSTDKKKIAAYLLEDVRQKFDEFKLLRGIKGDSQALNQLLSEYFGVADSLSPPPSLLNRVEALESALVNVSIGRSESSVSLNGLQEVLAGEGWLSEEEVADCVQMPLQKLRRLKGTQSDKNFARWLLKTSKEYGSPIIYSLDGYRFVEV